MIYFDSLLFILPKTRKISILLNQDFPRDVKVIKVNWDNWTEGILPSRNYLLLVDFHSTNEQIKTLSRNINIHKNCYVAVYNSPAIVTTSELAKFGKLRGFFYQNATSKQLYRGVKKLILGKYQLPTSIIEQLFDYYQSTIIRFGDPYVLNITPREREVLSKLKQGMSNFELADILFVSEHTVKSHLYQIFRKIKVKNRNQAIAWAYKYLP